MPFFGETIAIITVLCWTVSIQFFWAASKMVGATPVNIIRVAIALILFSIFLFFRDGAVFPTDFPIRSWYYLGVSGIVGFFIGDIFLFKALVELGPRVTMLIHSLSAPAAAVISWMFLGEQYALHQWLGILVTLTGVGIVIFERNQRAPARKLNVRRISWIGVAYGFAAMFGQAGGYVLSKAGIQTETGYLDAFAATQIRAIAAFVCFVLLFSVTGKWGDVTKALANKRALVYATTGAFVGPFIGVSLSLVVLQYLATGVAATFLSLVPICIIPFSIFLHKEHVSLRAISGVVIGLSGIYLLVS